MDFVNIVLCCVEFCRGKGYVVVLFWKDFCVCNNDLFLNCLYKGINSLRECKMCCVGVLVSIVFCEREECCGGDKVDNILVYIVIVVGSM